MSYGFYRMRPSSSFGAYLTRVAGNTPIAIGIIQGNGVIRNTPDIPGNDQSLPLLSLGKPPEPPKVADTMLAKVQGFSGDICDNCQGAKMLWAGHCLVCSECGTTTGCS